MSGLPPPSVAAVMETRWRTDAGRAFTTIVGKVTMALREDGKAALVQPAPIVGFDRIAPDQRYVVEAGEVWAWSAIACVIVQDGPLRFTLEAGGQPLAVAAPAGAPAGFSLAAAERSRFAPRTALRGPDGTLTLPPDLDGRYFVAARPEQQLPSLRADERFTLETAGFMARRRLPGFAIVATVQDGPRERAVRLVPDMLVVSGTARRVSIVSRAAVGADVRIMGHEVLPLARVEGMDTGDLLPFRTIRTERAPQPSVDALWRPAANQDDETVDIDVARLRAAPALAVPFPLSDPAEQVTPSTRGKPAVPATPFDPGFAPAPVVSAEGVVSTMAPAESMMDQLRAMRGALRAEGAPAHTPAPEPEPPPPAPTPPAPSPTQVAPPVPGAMAKPRFKRR